MNAPKNTPIIKDANWRSGTVYVDGVGKPGRISVRELEEVAKTTDADLRPVYADLAERSKTAIEAERRRSIAQHRGQHTASRREEWGYVTCVAIHDCNPVAHGNIVVVEECQCGAERHTNRNSGQSEQGQWS